MNLDLSSIHRRLKEQFTRTFISLSYFLCVCVIRGLSKPQHQVLRKLFTLYHYKYVLLGQFGLHALAHYKLEAHTYLQWQLKILSMFSVVYLECGRTWSSQILL